MTILHSCHSEEARKQEKSSYRQNRYELAASKERNSHQQLTDILALPRIEKGTDSFELRVWSKNAMINFSSITILRYQNSTWFASETVYWKNLSDTNFRIDSLKTVVFTPRISPQVIADSVLGFGLDTLPTQFLIPDFMDKTADGVTYVIELATKKKYKFLAYHSP